MSDPIVQVRGASRTFRAGQVEVVALRNANLTISRGEFVVILGPSGSGKTTLLNLIGGLDTPTSGQVIVDGIDVANGSEAELTRYRRDKVGYVFQAFNLIPTLTAWENVQLAAELVAKPRDVGQVLEEVGLSHRARHFPSELSGGEQQRVAIARGLVKNPPILIGDEPTGELDTETGRSILVLLRRINREQTQTVIVVTHNAAMAEMADRVVRLRNGEIVADEVHPSPIDPMEVSW